MDQKKVCPLRVLASETGSAARAGLGDRVRCAWYDQAAERCAILALARRA